jgi:Fe-S-cluster containining protein
VKHSVLPQLPALARKAESSTRKLFAKLKKSKPKDLDDVMEELHERTFRETDCLQCANCCKTTSPIFRDKDIERLSKFLRMKPSAFTAQYLHEDKDHDYVLNAAPCTFLGADNYCSVYEARPAACREYPHTDRKKFYQILDLTVKNTFICPAAYRIIEELKKRF